MNIDKKFILSKLKPYVGTLRILKYDQGTQDIIKELLYVHGQEAAEYDKIYQFFYTGDLASTARNIFKFLKQNVRYVIESGAKQTLKSPSALLVQGYGDCKQYSQFAGGILDAINRNKGGADWAYRFSSYNDKKNIQHVFVVAFDKSGREIWIDPVLPTFNEKKSYKYKIDKRPNNMALYKISGIDEGSFGKISLKKLPLKKIAIAVKPIAKKIIKVARPVSQAVKVVKFATPAGAASVVAKKVIKTVAKGVIKKPPLKLLKKGISKKVVPAALLKKVGPTALLKKVGPTALLKKVGPTALLKKVAPQALKKVVVKVPTSSARNAFLSLVLNNKGALATKMGSRMSQINKELKQVWEGLGGNYNNLQSTILKGSKTAISGVCSEMKHSNIGAINGSKLYTTALPILKKLEALLLSIGINVYSLMERGADEALKTVARTVAVNSTNRIVDINKAPEESVQPIIEPLAQREAQSTTEAVQTSVDTSGSTATVNVGTKSSTEYSKYILPAAAVAALYFLFKKQ